MVLNIDFMDLKVALMKKYDLADDEALSMILSNPDVFINILLVANIV